jgi:transposase-like protein
MTVSSTDGSPKRLFQQSCTPPVTTPVEALRKMMQALLQETLEAEFTRFLHAAPYERTAARHDVRNGTRPRFLTTRLCKVELRIPHDCGGAYQPSLFARYQRHEQAKMTLTVECYLQGISTRKVREVVEALCRETVSAGTVSRATKLLDGELTAWRVRQLDSPPYRALIVDAHYERIRREGRVLSTADLWVIGVAANGYREHLGVWIGNAESGPVWGRVFRDLHGRGLHGVTYVVSDEHARLRAALQRYFPDAVPQRCQMHYQRNALSKVSSPERQAALCEGLRHVWAAPTRAEAERRGGDVIASVRPALPTLAVWLEETLHKTIGFYALPEAEARRRLRTTNAAEREHEEIRRRTRVIRIFPNEASYLRLASALAADRNDH